MADEWNHLSELMLNEVKKNNIEGIRRYIERGANINYRDSNTRFPLHHAIGAKDKDVLITLLDLGADPNLSDRNSNTALMRACEFGDLEAVKILHQRGARLKARDSRRRTALALAATGLYGGDDEVMSYLIDQGIDINEADIDGNTPLMLAVRERKRKAVEFLLERGADIHIVNYYDKKSAFDLAQDERIRDLLQLAIEQQPPLK